MKLYPIHTGNFKLDGGAMFGVVPKSIWQKTNPADSNNMCDWAMRSLLIEDGNRLILIDSGIGNKQTEKFFSYYFLNGEMTLESSLKNHGFGMDDITDVFFTHLHFDHCGGAFKWGNDEQTYLEPVFKNAKFWSNELHWKWATEPNAREKASFLSENINPIKDSGRLNYIERKDRITNCNDLGFEVFFADGHTESQMLPLINYKGNKIAFMADLLPSVGHIPLPYVMGYDTRPLLTLEDRKTFFKLAADEKWILFLEHDFYNECCTVKHTEKGVRLDKTFAFSEI